MNNTTFIVLQTCAIAIVLAQPIFGWHAIPEFFNRTTASAVILGLVDGAILMAPSLLFRFYGH